MPNMTSKSDLLKIEKRIIDLELTVSEMKDSAKNLDYSAVSDFKQRIEELEDLIMVEQAGISELKEMMEETDTPEILEGKVDENLEKRVRNVESSITKLVERADFESKLGNIEKKLSDVPNQNPAEMDNLYNKFIQLQDELSELRLKLDGISKGIAEKAKESSTKKEKPDYDLNALSSKISEIVQRVNFLEKKVKESDVSQFEKEISKVSKDLVDNRSLLEQQIKEISGKLASFESKIREIEDTTADKFSNISQKIEKSKKELESKGNVSARDVESSVEKEMAKTLNSMLKEAGIEDMGKDLRKALDKIDEISDKIKSLESRIKPLEKMQKVHAQSPIIIE